MGHIESWLRYYDEHKAQDKERMNKAWKQAYQRAVGASKQGKKESSTMRSAMSACIVSLRKIGLLPREPDRWYCTREKIWIDIDDNVAVRRDVIKTLNTRFAERMWKNVTPGEATGGLEHGIPCLETAKKCHAWMLRCGHVKQANCLEAV